jgi:uncharacterized protein YdaT
MSAKSKGVNVVRHGDDWAVRRDGANRVTRVFDTQKQAIDFARPIARQDQTELRIQDRHGNWRDSDSYGNDPVPPVDTKH